MRTHNTCLSFSSTHAANLQAYAEGPTTLVQQDSFKFIVDEPPKLGGRGMGT